MLDPDRELKLAGAAESAGGARCCRLGGDGGGGSSPSRCRSRASDLQLPVGVGVPGVPPDPMSGDP